MTNTTKTNADTEHNAKKPEDLSAAVPADLHDYYVGQALIGLVMAHADRIHETCDGLARDAITMADAVMKARHP